jgi:hypothetical protein
MQDSVLDRPCLVSRSSRSKSLVDVGAVRLQIDLYVAAAGLLVGLTVGLTWMGGGAHDLRFVCTRGLAVSDAMRIQRGPGANATVSLGGL